MTRGFYVGMRFTPESEQRLHAWAANEGITKIGRVDPRLHVEECMRKLNGSGL